MLFFICYFICCIDKWNKEIQEEDFTVSYQIKKDALPIGSASFFMDIRRINNLGSATYLPE